MQPKVFEGYHPSTLFNWPLSSSQWPWAQCQTTSLFMLRDSVWFASVNTDLINGGSIRIQDSLVYVNFPRQGPGVAQLS